MIRGAELKALKEDCVTESLGSPTPVAFVSSNDLAQAAVAEVTSAKVGCMYANMRGAYVQTRAKNVFFPQNAPASHLTD